MWIVVVAVVLTAFMYGWYVIWWALGIFGVLAALAYVFGGPSDEAAGAVHGPVEKHDPSSPPPVVHDPSPLRAGPVQFAQSLSAVASRAPDGGWRCPKCGGAQFHPVRKTATKVMFGVASLLGPARHVRCMTCSTLYRAD